MSMPTMKEIEEFTKWAEEHPHEVDELTKIARNQVGGQSADALERISGFLPDPETEYRNRENLTAVFDTTRRAGAGGTRAGLVGIRPNGGRAASEFLDKFTGVGRMAPEKKMFEEKITPKEGRDLGLHNNRVIIYKDCMDCMKPCNRDDCMPVLLPLAPEMNEITRARFETVGLRPGDFICYIICGRCAKRAMEKAKKLNATGIDYVFMGQTIKAGQRYLKERSGRISHQVMAYIRRERQNPDSDIFYGECKERWHG